MPRDYQRESEYINKELFLHPYAHEYDTLITGLTFYNLRFWFADYVGFMKKVMKQMQSDYPMMSKVELELTQEREMDALPIRPSKYGKALFLTPTYLWHMMGTG